MIDNKTTYFIIRVREKLDERWGEWFEGVMMRSEEQGTVLSGYLDQSALHGIIGRIQRLGLNLVAVNQGEPPDNATNVR